MLDEDIRREPNKLKDLSGIEVSLGLVLGHTGIACNLESKLVHAVWFIPTCQMA